MEISDKKIDFDASNNGMWFDYDDETSFKIRQLNSLGFKSAMPNSKSFEVFIEAEEGKELTLEEQAKLNASTIAEFVLVDWKGIKEDGKEFKYSVDNAIELLFNMPHVGEWIEQKSATVSNFYQKRSEEAVKK